MATLVAGLMIGIFIGGGAALIFMLYEIGKALKELWDRL